MKKNILITGGRGFIGKNLTQSLINSGFEVYAPSSQELNILEKEDIKQWNDKQINHVVHLAGRTVIPDSWDNPEDFFEVNTMGTLNILRYCRENRVDMTYISAYIYGIPDKNPISERDSINPNNPYAKSKHISEEMCEFFCKYFDMNISVLRLFNVYGPGQSRKFIVPFVIEQALNEQDEITVRDLKPKRDFIFIDDVCRAIEMSIFKTQDYQLYNVGSGISYSVEDIIDLVQDELGIDKKKISEHNERRNELNEVVADIRRISEEWEWGPKITIKDGLMRCIKEASNGKKCSNKQREL